MTAILPVAGVPLSTESRTAGPELSGRPRGRRLRGYPLVLTISADVAIAVLVALSLASVGTSPTDIAFLLVLGWPALLLLDGAYSEPSAPSSRRRRLGVLRAGAVLGLACWALPTVVDVVTGPAALVLATATLTTTSYAARVITDVWTSHSTRVQGGTRVLVAGEATDVARAVAELHRGPHPSWQVVCACVAGDTPCDAPGVPITAGLDDLVGRAETVGAEAVLVLPCHDIEPLALRRLAWRLEATGTALYVGTALHDVDPCRATLLTAGDLDLLAVRSTPSTSATRVLKELMERTAAGVMLLMLLPVLLGVAFAVRRDSPGPAIFRQRRIGRDGRDFTMYKFRTMRTDADARRAELAELNESEGGVLFKVRQDPRITRLGGVLRKYSVDELPQLVNVLLGDMALVGPRPALADEVARYEHDPRRRLAVKPGLTGLWQVSGRSDLSWEDTVRLDVHYVDNWSLGLDLRILCRTIGTVIRHEGAY